MVSFWGKAVQVAVASVAAVGFVGVTNVRAEVPGQPTLVTRATERVFLPHGFDDNDNAQVVLDGELPNSCFKAGRVQQMVDVAKRTIHLRDEAYFYDGCWCAQVMSSYTQAVDLGIIPQGRYQVVIENAEGGVEQRGVLRVSQARTIAPDDFLYAPVSEVAARIPQEGSGEGVVLGLRGVFTNSCMRMKEVRPLVHADNVIEVLPIAEMSEGQDCHAARIPFEVRVPLDRAPTGRTLVHVRVLNGRSINQVYTF